MTHTMNTYSYSNHTNIIYNIVNKTFSGEHKENMQEWKNKNIRNKKVSKNTQTWRSVTVAYVQQTAVQIL